MTDVLIRNRNGEDPRRGHVKSEAENGVMQRKPRNSWGPRSWERQGRVFA